MKKKDIDEGYIVGDFYIIKSPIKEGWLHIVNIKTSWQIKVMMGANTAKFLSLPQQEIFDRINGIYIQSMMSLYDSEYALKIAKDAVSYMSEKAKKMEKVEKNENEDIEKVKKDEFMMKIATSSDEEIMDMIVNGEIKYEYFRQEQED
jgi:mannitol-specific phosphotransferase system IIBC component